MAETRRLIDASVFLGMHHENDRIRQQSLAFFRVFFHHGAWMNFEQVGICDAVIWRMPREVQDAYYPFMDVLHSEMDIQRQGYRYEYLDYALKHFKNSRLSTYQAMLVSQVLCDDFMLYTHDAALLKLDCLQQRLGDFSVLDNSARFSARLEQLYPASRQYIHTDKDWQHVETRYLHPLDHTA